jgi:hypothetical protein
MLGCCRPPGAAPLFGLDWFGDDAPVLDHALALEMAVMDLQSFQEQADLFLEFDHNIA